MMEMPVMRLELENMRHSILRVIGQNHEQVEIYLSDELTKFVENFDFQAAVAKQLGPIFEQVIAEILTSHFKYGEGRRMLEEAMSEMLPSGEPPAAN